MLARVLLVCLLWMINDGESDTGATFLHPAPSNVFALIHHIDSPRYLSSTVALALVRLIQATLHPYLYLLL